MKNTIKQSLVKVISMVLIIFLTMPSQIFASSLFRKNDKTYDGTQSIMGIASSNGTNDLLVSQGEESGQAIYQSDKSITENEYYIIEKSGNYSKARGLITYRIAISPKTTDNPDQINKAVFAINSNTEQSELKVDGVATVENGHETETKFKEERPSFLSADSNIDSLSIETENTNKSLVYYISTKLEDSDLSTEHTFGLDIALINQENKTIVQDRYSIKKDAEDNLVEDENTSLISGNYTAKTSNLLGENPSSITWTDYIFSKTDKEFIYQINLDESQDTTNAQIHLDFYQAKENGFVVDKSFSQNIPFTKELKLQIPKGYIGKLEVKTNVKENANPQKFTYNNKEIANPDYKEEGQSAEDEDPLPNKSSNKDAGSNSSNHIITDQKDLDFSANSNTKKEEQTADKSLNKDAGSNSSNDIIADEKDLDFSRNSNTKKEEQTTDKSLNMDAGSNSSNDIISDKKDLDFSENSKTENAEIPTSAIVLNRDAYISKLEDEKRLTSELKKVTNQLTYLLESYSKEELSLENLESKLKYIAQAENIDAKQSREIITALIAGLNEDKFKAANLDPSKLVYEAIEKDQVKTAVAGPEAKLPEKTPDKLAAEKLAEDGITIEDFQNYMYELEEKYNLTNEDADRIYTENAEAIQKLIEKYREENTIEEARNNFAVLDGGFSNERFITEIQYITTQLTSAENESKLKSLAQEYYNDNNPIDIIRNKYVGWKINLPGKEELGRDIQELKTSGKYDFNALDFSLYAPAGQSLANYKVVIEDAGNGKVLARGIMTETGSMMTYGTSISKSSLPDAGLNIYVIAEAPVKRKEYNVGLKVSPDQNYVMALKNAFEEKFEELKKRYPLLIKYINTDQAEPYKNGINLIDTRMVFKEPAQDLYQQMSNSTPFLSTEYNENNTDTNTGIGNNRLSVFGNLNQSGSLTWTVSELITLETLQSKSSIGRDAYTATSNRKQVSPEVQLLIPKGNSYEVKDLDRVRQTNLVNQLPDIPGTIVNYTYKDTASDVYSVNTFRLSSGKTATIQLKKVEKGAEYTNQDTINHSKRIHAQSDGKFYEQVLDLSNIMRAFIPEDKSIHKNERFNDPGVKNTGVMVWCLTYGKGDPSKARGFTDLLTKKQLDANNPVGSGKLIYDGMFTPKGETSTLHKANMTDDDYAKVFEYMQRIFWYAEQMRNEKKLDEKTFSQIVQYNIYHFTSNRGETWYKGDVANAGGSVKNMTEQEHNLAIELKNRVTNAEGWSSVDRINDVHVVLYSHDKDKYQQVISGDVHSKSAPKGSVSIKKIDSDTNSSIANVGFKLTSVKDGKTYSGNTDSNGIISFNELPLGEYTLEETSAPSGYVLEKGKRTIFLTAENANQAFSVTYYNRKSKIEFIKVDENSQIIPGATFELRQNGRTLTGYDKSADSSGKFGWTGLRQGTYEVYEKSLPSGYEDYKHNLGKKVAEFTIDGQNNVSAMTNLTNSLNSKSNVIINKPIEKTARIKIVKINANNADEKLSGVEFTLSPTNETSGDPVVGLTDEKGELYFWDIPNGDYTLKETKAPDGFIVENWTKYIYVRNGKVTETLPTNSPNTTSTQASTTIKVSSKDQLDSRLFANISDYYAYKVKNTPTEIKFKKTFSDNGNYNVKVVENLPAADNENAYFTLKDNLGNSYHEAKYQSVANNTITFTKLPADRTYTLTEQVPLGFNKADEYRFEIDKNGNIKPMNFSYETSSPVEILNSKTPKAKFAIRKIDADTNLDLAGATFTLTGESLEEPIVKTTSTTENPIIFENLDVNKSYTLKETGVPAGYRDENKEYAVNIDKDGDVTIQDLNGKVYDGLKTFTVANKKIPKGRFRIEKVDKSNNPLDDVTFTLTANSGTDRFEKVRTTNADGIVEFTNLNPGNYTLVESEAKAGYVASKKTWNVNVGEDGLVTITEIDKLFGQGELQDLINLPTAYAAEADKTINLAFVVENLRGKSEGVVEEYNKNINEIKNSLAELYGDKATITLVANGHNAGQQIIHQNVPVTSDIDLSLKQFDEGGGDSHLDEAIDRVKTAFSDRRASENYVVIMQSGKGDEYVDDKYYNLTKGSFAPEDNITSVVLYVEDPSADTSKYIKANENGSLINDENSIIVASTEQNLVLERLGDKLPILGIDGPIADASVDPAQRLTLDDVDTLRQDGYIITNSSDYDNSNISVLKVLNRKPTYPTTGGTGAKIAFALIGTAVMITGLAYYGMYLSEKYRRKSHRART